MDLLLQKNFSIFTLRENMNWNNNKKGALNLFDSSAKGMHTGTSDYSNFLPSLHEPSTDYTESQFRSRQTDT